jgi:subtilisin family serine protease
VALGIAAAIGSAPAAGGPPPGNLPNAPATPDNLSGEQWSLERIDAFEAHAITGGSPLVRVAVIDTGIDQAHPEFAGRIDFASSVSCASGSPNPAPPAWRDDNGHGTHVAGIIAAGDNEFGIVGVAPRVQLVIVKVANSGQPITPAATACAFEWVADHQIDVANASFAVDKGPTQSDDPLDFYCRSDSADQRAIKAVQKAVQAARRSGATIVASAGNEGIDLAHPPTGNDCIRMPVELPGVVGVSSEGRAGVRAAVPPSNYGVGVIDVVAPGGDDMQGGPVAGRILSAFPSYIPVPPIATPNIIDPAAPPRSPYRYMRGTSQATAHVSGVAALIVSRYGDLRSPQNGKLRPGFVGHGRVNALRAITHEPGNG